MAEKELKYGENSSPDALADVENPPLEDPGKTTWERAWPVIACGAGLFSDGYLQSVIGAANYCLKNLYGNAYTKSSAQSNVTSIAFAGTVLGQLVFGFTADHYSRKWSLMVSTIILFVFAALGAGAWGANGTPAGIFAALTAYRFLLGIGIGGEYPAGSVGCAESTGELRSGVRNRWFIWFTNCQIDLGFVMGALMPMIIAAGTNNLTIVWRTSLALGVLPPLSLIYLRFKMKEPEAYSRNNMKKNMPYLLALKFYGPRLLVVMSIWFIYDFLTYPFSIYSATWIGVIAPNQTTWQVFGWSTLVNFFYLPGAIIGSWLSDIMGPRLALSVFVAAQGVVGFAMTGAYPQLSQPGNIAGFVVLYGIFLMLGEMGPGDNIGLVAAKTSATGIRGEYYAIAAAFGKIGGFIGNYIFPIIIADGGSNVIHQGQYPFYVASSLCFVSAAIVWFLPRIDQDTIEKEDKRFMAYLIEHGWDVSQMGNTDWQDKRRTSVQEIGHGGQLEH